MATAWTNGNWNNTDPANTKDPKLGAGDMRTIKLQVGDRLSDMIEGFSSTETDSGLVGFKTGIFRPQDPSPAVVVNAVQLYAKDVDDKARLHTKDEDNNEVELIPHGAIIMWSGAMADIPTGWSLCDGVDGRPDMLDRFVKCVASGAGVPGTAGGAATHTHTGPAHTHTSTVHSHATPITGYGENTNPPAQSGAMQVDNVGNVARATLQPQSGQTTPGATGSGGTGATGSSSSNPAYFEVAFIINS